MFVLLLLFINCPTPPFFFSLISFGFVLFLHVCGIHMYLCTCLHVSMYECVGGGQARSWQQMSVFRDRFHLMEWGGALSLNLALTASAKNPTSPSWVLGSQTVKSEDCDSSLRFAQQVLPQASSPLLLNSLYMGFSRVPLWYVSYTFFRRLSNVCV